MGLSCYMYWSEALAASLSKTQCLAMCQDIVTIGPSSMETRKTSIVVVLVSPSLRQRRYGIDGVRRAGGDLLVTS